MLRTVEVLPRFFWGFLIPGITLGFSNTRYDNTQEKAGENRKLNKSQRRILPNKNSDLPIVLG